MRLSLLQSLQLRGCTPLAVVKHDVDARSAAMVDVVPVAVGGGAWGLRDGDAFIFMATLGSVSFE